MPFDTDKAVPEAMKKMPDKRVSHYWDGQSELVNAYARILGLEKEGQKKEGQSKEAEKEYMPAWDVYFLFPRDTEWKDEPPAPSYWMHQLRTTKGERFNGEKFAEELKKLLQPTKTEKK